MFINIIKQLTKLNKTFAAKTTDKHQNKPSKITPVRLAIALLLEHPHIVNALPDISILEHLDIPGIPLLNKLLVLCKQNPDVNSAMLIEQFRGLEEGKQLTKLMCLQHHIETENAETTFLDVIERFLNIFIEQRTEELLSKEKISGLTKIEKQELHSLLSA